MNLSEQQTAIVDWTVNQTGSAIVVARAGCGKTFTVIRGIVRAIAENDLGEVAGMAFNKAAGEEMKHRVQQMAKECEREGDSVLAEKLRDWRRVQLGTCHSFGFGAVRRWAKDVKVDGDKVKTICKDLSRGDEESVYHQQLGPICKLVSLAKQSAFGFKRPITDRTAWFDLAEHHAVNDMAEGGRLDEIVDACIEVYNVSIKRDREVVDFDDMILVPLVHDLRMWPKDWVIIDEAQDTNAARRALALKMLKPRTGRLVAVGDDRQAIYGFTGADSDSLELIRAEVNAITLPLTVTYRCPKAVVVEANKLVPDLVAHETAPEGVVRAMQYVRSIGDEGEESKTQYWFEDEMPTSADAILCRNTKPLIDQAYTFLAAGIGCRVEGREIGEGLIQLATRWKRIKTLPALDSKLDEYKQREVQKWLAKGREERAQAAEDKVESLQAIIKGLRRDDKDSVEDLVEWIRSLFGDTQPGEIPNVVTLSTIHKAKGREWDRVYLLHRRETLPSKWARKPWQMQQETNLEYVAITRAKSQLIYVD